MARHREVARHRPARVLVPAAALAAGALAGTAFLNQSAEQPPTLSSDDLREPNRAYAEILGIEPDALVGWRLLPDQAATREWPSVLRDVSFIRTGVTPNGLELRVCAQVALNPTDRTKLENEQRGARTTVDVSFVPDQKRGDWLPLMTGSSFRARSLPHGKDEDGAACSAELTVENADLQTGLDAARRVISVRVETYEKDFWTGPARRSSERILEFQSGETTAPNLTATPDFGP